MAAVVPGDASVSVANYEGAFSFSAVENLRCGDVVLVELQQQSDGGGMRLPVLGLPVDVVRVVKSASTDASSDAADTVYYIMLQDADFGAQGASLLCQNNKVPMTSVVDFAQFPRGSVRMMTRPRHGPIC